MLNIFSISESKQLLKITIIGFFCFKLFTLKLWITMDRAFPVVSIANTIDISNPFFHTLLTVLSFILYIFLIIKLQRKVLIILLMVELLLLFTDVMRWQPSVYQYTLTMVIYLLFPHKFKSYFVLLLSATYIFSGLHKFSLSFLNINWGNNILIDIIGLSPQFRWYKELVLLGVFIPALEFVSGLLILTRFRQYGFVLILLTHLAILCFIISIGLYNSLAIFSWNIVMIVFAIYFLSNTHDLKINFNIRTSILCILLFVVPCLHFTEIGYPYISFDIYSGTKHYIKMSTPLYDKSPLQTYAKNSNSNFIYENTTHLAFYEMGVPVTHSKWLYRRIITSFKRDYPSLSPCYEIYYYPFKTARYFHKF